MFVQKPPAPLQAPLQDGRPHLLMDEALASRRGSGVSVSQTPDRGHSPPPGLGMVLTGEELDPEAGLGSIRPARFGIAKNLPTYKLKTLRIHKKDFKKSGNALRGKNVLEGPRVKEKDLKKTLR